jgi:acetyl esterase/lipase
MGRRRFSLVVVLGSSVLALLVTPIGGSVPKAGATAPPECVGLSSMSPPPNYGPATYDTKPVPSNVPPLVVQSDNASAHQFVAYLPPGGGAGHAAIVMIHGGDFDSGNPGPGSPSGADACMAAQFAAHGIAAFWIGYREPAAPPARFCTAQTMAGSTTLTATGSCTFSAADIGRLPFAFTVTNALLFPPLAMIQAVPTSTTATMSAAATATNAAAVVEILPPAPPPPSDANSSPAAFDDVQTFVRFLRQPAQTQQFGLDPTRIGAFGFSAGGQLSSMLATFGTGPLDQDARVLAASSWSGPSDFTATSLVTYPTASFLVDTASNYLGCSTAPGAGQAACLAGPASTASPVVQVTPGDAPMLLASGNPDLVVPEQQTSALGQALTAVGVPNQVVLAGSCHAEGCDTIAWDPTLQFFLTELALKIQIPANAAAAPAVATPTFTG